MSTAIQLDFLEPLDENQFLRKIVLQEKESSRKTAKKLFALNSELKTEILLLRGDLEFLKSQLNRKAEILSFCIEK